MVWLSMWDPFYGVYSLLEFLASYVVCFGRVWFLFNSSFKVL